MTTCIHLVSVNIVRQLCAITSELCEHHTPPTITGHNAYGLNEQGHSHNYINITEEGCTVSKIKTLQYYVDLARDTTQNNNPFYPWYFDYTEMI